MPVAIPGGEPEQGQSSGYLPLVTDGCVDGPPRPPVKWGPPPTRPRQLVEEVPRNELASDIEQGTNALFFLTERTEYRVLLFHVQRRERPDGRPHPATYGIARPNPSGLTTVSVTTANGGPPPFPSPDRWLSACGCSTHSAVVATVVGRQKVPFTVEECFNPLCKSDFTERCNPVVR